MSITLQIKKSREGGAGERGEMLQRVDRRGNGGWSQDLAAQVWREGGRAGTRGEGSREEVVAKFAPMGSRGTGKQLEGSGPTTIHFFRK